MASGPWTKLIPTTVWPHTLLHGAPPYHVCLYRIAHIGILKFCDELWHSLFFKYKVQYVYMYFFSFFTDGGRRRGKKPKEPNNNNGGSNNDCVQEFNANESRTGRISSSSLSLNNQGCTIIFRGNPGDVLMLAINSFKLRYVFFPFFIFWWYTVLDYEILPRKKMHQKYGK